MITLFAIPKPFKGHNRTIQRNAIRSWISVPEITQLILLGNDEGVHETSLEFGIQHISSVETNEFGTPLLSSAFNLAQLNATNGYMLYINSDIILPPDFFRILNGINFKDFLISGRRLNVDINVEFANFNCLTFMEILHKYKDSSSMHGFAGMDYFIFPANQVKLPPFAVGRPGWDSWLIWKSKEDGIPVLDASGRTIVIHQNHDYSHSAFGEIRQVSGPEKKKNFEIAGGRENMMTLREADWVLTLDEVCRPKGRRKIFWLLSRFKAWRRILSWKRNVQDKIA